MQFFIEPDFPSPPQCYRSVCEACGVGGGRRGVRVVHVTSVEIDHQDGFYTHLFLCELCVEEWARGLGMLSPQETESLLAQNYTQGEEILSLRAELDSLQDIRAAIERLAVVAKA